MEIKETSFLSIKDSLWETNLLVGYLIRDRVGAELSHAEKFDLNFWIPPRQTNYRMPNRVP